ncbi:MAG: YihA family ribosome biogenesis GTP-binding protein [Clostridiales bacterium]|nr:YihA family ribosome biogenesis GTP-binding protein [Clostridiales bacterium]
MNFHNAEFFTSYGKHNQIAESDRQEFVFVGRSNVGKSSLINKLLNRKSLARVSSVPGKTATINFYSLEHIYLVDLPGYGYAKVSQKEKLRWSKLIEGYLADDREIGLVFQLIDFRHPPTNDDLAMIEYLVENELPFVIILTKVDKLKTKRRNARWTSLQNEVPYSDQIEMIPFSSITGEGVERMKEIIEEIAIQPDSNN